MWRQSASVTGALQLGFADVLQWWEARFERITLEDRNLPEIAARRVLRPRNEAARQQIDRAYADTEKVRREVFETPLTPRADSAMFRKVYPFSPALVETLVAVSSLLQRERTALKVMLQILVDRRETLDLGEIVPVGDLFDAIAEGDEPFATSNPGRRAACSRRCGPANRSPVQPETLLSTMKSSRPFESTVMTLSFAPHPAAVRDVQSPSWQAPPREQS